MYSYITLKIQLYSNGQLYDIGCTATWHCRKEGNVLLNNTLNTFYIWLYGVGLYGIENTAIWQWTNSYIAIDI